ncbi:MAG: HAD hydrolase family protein [Betaproteobacteria bacterium]|nr:HAD hydrolase family protein [Betaproteobacteria bacterium]
METAARAARVRLLFLDVDGVLTDGRVYFFSQGVARAFNTLDGMGVRRLLQSGVQVALVSAAADEGDIARRGRELGITRIHTGVDDKCAAVRRILLDESLAPEDAAFMGDDLPDLAAMQYVGFAVAPKTAAPEVLAAAHWVPGRAAGGGAVRELCDKIMAARG